MTEKENHLPNLSSEERAHALELAMQARRRYAALKARVKSGELTFTDAMDEEDAKRILVTSLLQSVPGIGASKAVGDRPVVGVRLLFALRAVLRRRVGTAFLGIIRLHGFGLGICTGLVADAIIGTAADERDEGKAADGGDDLPVVWLLLAFRVCLHVVLIRRRFGGIPVVHLDIVLFIFIVLHGCIPLSN